MPHECQCYPSLVLQICPQILIIFLMDTEYLFRNYRWLIRVHKQFYTYHVTLPDQNWHEGFTMHILTNRKAFLMLFFLCMFLCFGLYLLFVLNATYSNWNLKKKSKTIWQVHVINFDIIYFHISDSYFLISFVLGFISWRSDTTGSWFISILCEVLQNRAKESDFVSILTEVNHKLAEMTGRDPLNTRIMQIGESTNNFRKQLFFNPPISWSEHKS